MTTWNELLSNGSITKHTTSLTEMNSLRSLVERDIEDAELAGLSPDRAFGIAYSAVLILSKMVLAASGYRVKGHGAHYATISGLELAMGSSVSVWLLTLMPVEEKEIS